MFAAKIKCNKCGLYIISQNKLIHDAQCNPVRNLQNSESSTNFPANRSELLGYSRDDRIISNNNNNFDEEFWYCTTCQNYLDLKEKADHILSHQYQDEFLNQGNEDELEERTRDESNTIDTSENPFLGRDFRVNRNYNNINNTTYRNNPYDSNFISQTNTNPFLNNHRNIINSNDPLSNFNRRRTNEVSFNGIDFSSRFGNPQSTTTITRTISHPNGGTTVITTTSNGSNRSMQTFSSNVNNNFQNLGGVNNFDPFNSNNDFFSDIFFTHPSSIQLESFLRELQERMNNSRLNPVNENLISALPEIEIKDLSKIPTEKLDCVICLSKYELNEKVIILPCTHMFHTECLKSWFRNQDSCPICKFRINESSINGV